MFSKENLTNKSVVFTDVITRKQRRNRSVALLCPECLGKDADFNQEAYSTPGNRSEAKMRAEAVKADTLLKIANGEF